MKNKILLIASFAFLACPKVNFAQTITLGSAADFALFSTNGAILNSGITHVTGNVGTQAGSSTGFGNVNGVMHDQDGSSMQAKADLLIAYGQINAAAATIFPAPLLGNGDTLFAGVDSIAGAATLNLDLYLDAENDPNAVFVIKIHGSFSTAANSKVKLINGAKACNVYWCVEGLVSMATGTSMKGNVIANTSAIVMNSLDTLEGRALSIGGAVTVDGVLVYTPIGCNSPTLMGPAAPALGSTSCYALFTRSGSLTNAGVSTIIGDVGTNVGLTSGFDSSTVTGTIHPIPDGSTAACGADLLIAYDYLNLLNEDIELLYPAQFGRNLTLTPHTYLLGPATATILTDTLYLDALNEQDAVFVIQINAAFSTSVNSKVLLINGAQAKNVYWKIDGAVDINDYSIFNGSIISAGAINLKIGVNITGRAQTITGAFATAAITSENPDACGPTSTVNVTEDKTSSVTIAPNPFSTYTTIAINDASQINNAALKIYNVLGAEVMSTKITKQLTTLDTGDLISGIYFYTITDKNKTIQSGRLVSQQ